MAAEKEKARMHCMWAFIWLLNLGSNQGPTD